MSVSHSVPDRSFWSFPAPQSGPVRSSVRRAACLALATTLVLVVVLALGSLSAPARAAVPPGSFTVSSVTSTSAKLSWTASSGSIGYRVYRGPSSAADTALTLIATTDASVTSYTATNLRSSFGYKFLVAALDLGNAEARSASKTVTTTASTDTTAPAAPSSTSVLATAFSSSRIDVIWGASSSTDVAYYEVLRGGVVVGTVERPMATKFSDNGLTAGTTYSYQVRAVDSAGNRSALTTTKSPKTLAAGTVKIVRGPYASNVTGTSAIISFYTNISTTGTVSFSGGPSASDSGGTLHKLTVSGLTPGTQYSYTVSGGGVSASGSVRTAKAAGAPYTFAVIGDFGAGSTAEQQNATNIAGYGSDFVQTVGDNIYPSAGFPDPSPTTQYSDFDARIFKQMGGVFKTQSFFPANGNHEYFTNGQWWGAFPMPGSNHAWYSYNWGDAHILVLDTMQPTASGSAQYSFVQSDLASSAATNAKWRIVVSPNPPYNTTNTPTGGSPGARNLVPLFQTGGVNLVLSGDSHNYQRTKPLVNGAPVTSGGITYVVTGGGGNGTNALTSAMPTWQVTRAAAFETLKIQVSPTALTVSAIQASNGAVLDTFTLGTASSDTTPPSVPTNVAGTSPSSSSVNLTWTASTDNVGVAHYDVFRNSTQIAGAAPTGTSYTDTGLAPSTTYTYTVRAVDAAGNASAQSSPAASVTTQPSSDTTPPSTPTGLTGTPANTSVALSWTASTDNVGVAHYNVYRNGTQIAGAAPTGTSYTDTGLTPATAYSYTVSAVDAAGNISGQSTAFATTTTNTGGGGGTTVTLTPSNDSTIDPVTTDTITNTRLKVDASAPQNDMLMKFTVPSTCTTVTAASLTLTVGSSSTDPSVRGGDFYATSPSDPNAGWSESSVVWTSAPLKVGTPVSLTGAVAANTAYTLNATSIVQAAGGTGQGATFTLRGSNTSGDGAGYYSKEGATTAAQKPQLTLTCG